MGINDVQNTAAAAAQAAAAAADKIHREDMRDYQKQINKTTEVNKNLAEMMDKSSSERGTAIVSQAVAAFAKSSVGKLFFQKEKFVKELQGKDSFGDVDQMENEDRVDISRRTRVQKIQQLTKSLKQEYQKLDVDSKTMLKEYSALYAKVITTSSGVAAAQLDRMEKKLKSKGISSNQLFELKMLVKTSVRGSVVSQIKDAFLKRMISTDMVFEWSTATRGLNEVLSSVVNSELLGGVDFGNYKGGLQGTVDHVKDELSRELRLVLKEMMDQKMTERLVSDKVKPAEVKKEIADYLKIAKRIGFNTSEYLQKSWKDTYINEGLFAYEAPEKESLINANLNQNQQDSQDQETSVDVSEEQTEDYYIAALRAGYMSKALGQSWRASLRANYKIRKVKNKMIKLGIYYEELNDKVQKEAELIASAKIMEMLNEAFMERATLYKLAGPAFRMVETKILSLMKNAQQLGMDISEYDFNTLRDKANIEVFNVAKRELHLTLVSLTVKDQPFMREKKNKLVALLTRLKEESNIDDDLGVSEDVLRDKLKLSA